MENVPVVKQRDALSALLNQDAIKVRFEQVLGKKAPGFMSSIISATNANPQLKKADPMSIISAAAIAASLDLPVNPSLGFSHIVPYSGMATFQIGYKGLIQLGMRSGQYRTINAAVVYEGELISRNRFTGEMVFDEAQRTAEKIAGYVAYFRLLNGFEKWYYMTLEEVQKHGKRYSKSFSSEQGKWRTDFDAMALKTVLKMMLSKYGILSIEMQTAVQADQAIIKESGDYEYPDNLDQEGQDQPQSTADAIKGKLKQAKKPVEAPTPIETDLSPGPCPDNPSVTYTLSHCDACPTRQGCPAFDDSSGEPV